MKSSTLRFFFFTKLRNRFIMIITQVLKDDNFLDIGWNLYEFFNLNHIFWTDKESSLLAVGQFFPNLAVKLWNLSWERHIRTIEFRSFLPSIPKNRTFKSYENKSFTYSITIEPNIVLVLITSLLNQMLFLYW